MISAHATVSPIASAGRWVGYRGTGAGARPRRRSAMARTGRRRVGTRSPFRARPDVLRQRGAPSAIPSMALLTTAAHHTRRFPFPPRTSSNGLGETCARHRHRQLHAAEVGDLSSCSSCPGETTRVRAIADAQLQSSSARPSLSLSHMEALEQAQADRARSRPRGRVLRRAMSRRRRDPLVLASAASQDLRPRAVRPNRRRPTAHPYRR